MGETIRAEFHFYTYLKPGGYARIAVPDGFHTDRTYIDWVMPGTGYNGDDHKQLFNYKSLSQLLTGAGFGVQLREYWDENGCFHSRPLNDEDGAIRRYLFGSKFFLDSFVVGCRYTSLTVDAIKPGRAM
jgi:predicted SAM-dependent methyltransferase